MPRATFGKRRLFAKIALDIHALILVGRDFVLQAAAVGECIETSVQDEGPGNCAQIRRVPR